MTSTGMGSTVGSVRQGIDDALLRVGNLYGTKLAFGLTDEPGQEQTKEQVEKQVTSVLQDEEVSEHFVRLFAEIATLAHVARRTYGEPDLTPDDLQAFLPSIKDILNSFLHR